ncbi:MAG: mandelate racemase/muconate lactonizing enzyme family protein, partial [Geminicoccaceae bacterium]|nr:mandelate racemase/muconate lactonizing enzyme family protein [Geminicoccaceae bacterium]
VDASVIRVVTDDGLVGIGSGDPMPGFIGHEELFLGQDPRDLDRHFRIIDNLSFHVGRCWPLDLALWDLFGKIVGQPVWRLLGGATSKIPLYASSGAVREPKALAALASHYLDQGFRAMKVRFNAPDWRTEIEQIEAVREAVGERIEIMVDANQAWRMPWDSRPPYRLKDALQLARALETLDVYWLEEPLHRGDLAGLAALRRATSIRIAGAEMAREMHDLDQLIERGCLDVLQPDAALISGISGLSRLARRAEAAGVQFSPHTWGNGVGLMANAQLAGGVGGCPFLEYPYDPNGWTADRRDFLLSAPLQASSDGHLVLPDAPGLGIELDEERLRATAHGVPTPVAVAEAPSRGSVRRWFDWLRG